MEKDTEPSEEIGSLKRERQMPCDKKSRNRVSDMLFSSRRQKGKYVNPHSQGKGHGD